MDPAFAGFPAASYEEQLRYPPMLKAYHHHMQKGGRSPVTCLNYMRAFSGLLTTEGKWLHDCASAEYLATVKASPRNRAGNGQMAAGVRLWVQFWEAEGAQMYADGTWPALDEPKDKMYIVKERPRGPYGEAPKAPGAPKGAAPPEPAEVGKVEADKKASKETAKTEKAAEKKEKEKGGKKDTTEAEKKEANAHKKEEGASPAKVRKTENGATAVPTSSEELVEEYDGFVLRYMGGMWTVLPDDVVSIDIPAITSRTEATGCKCTSSDAARCTLLYAPEGASDVKAEITMHADAGKMEIRTASKEVALRAAQSLVDVWLLEAGS